MLPIDIRTLLVVLGITNFIQVIALILQYRINKSYRGIGWWVVAFILIPLGFILTLLRDVVSIPLITIVLSNTLTFSGTIFLCIGIFHFLERKEPRGALIAILSVFILSFTYFTYGVDDINIRTAILSIFIAAISILTARALYVYKPAAIRASANTLAGAWLFQGCFFAFRAVATLTFAPIANFFNPTWIQTVTYLFTLMLSAFVTFGLIIMVNQRVNAEMKESKEHFEMIFHTTLDGVMITRLNDGMIVSVNRGFSELTGFTAAEAIGKTILEFNIWNNPDDRQKMVAELSEKGFCEDFEAVLGKKDGSLAIGSISARLISLQGIPHIFSSTRNITNRVQEEDQVRRLNFELEQRVAERTANLEAAKNEISAFTHSISHDLRVPVRAIDGFSQILADEYQEKLDSEGQRLVQIIRQNTHKLDQLLNGLLALLDVSHGELGASRIDMTVLVQEVYNEVLTPEEQVKYTFTLLPLPEANGEPALIRLVWNNLIANAVKYTLPKPERIIQVAGKVENGMAVYSITDNGVGFDPRYIHKLFGLFERLHKMEQFEGEGIGLAIVQRIIQRHAGTVWADGAPGEGATFYFSLPGGVQS